MQLASVSSHFNSVSAAMTTTQIECHACRVLLFEGKGGSMVVWSCSATQSKL